MNELISVIMPTYKRKYSMIERAINSILNQTYKNIELIIVDDSPESFSERKTIKEKVLSIKDKRVRYIQHEVNKGACVARNTGIKNSKGSIIAFLDDDDEWLPTKLEEQMKCLHEENVDMVYCFWIKHIIGEKKTVEKLRTLTKRPDETAYESLLYKNYIGSTSLVLVKKECFDKVGLFKEDMPSCQDWEMWLRIAKKFNVGCVKKPLLIYYDHRGERITTNIDKQIAGHEEIFKICIEDLKTHPKALKSQYYKLVLIYADNKEFKKAFELWNKSNKVRPSDIKESFLSLLKIIKRCLFK